MKIIGVTGTNGKTTCVELICQLLKDNINCASFGTLGIKLYKENSCFITNTKLTTLGNNELHKNLLEVGKNHCQLVAMEVSSHGLDQNRVAGVDFSEVVFTNLSHDHLDYHKNMENYFQAKLKLFTDYSNKLEKIIINLDDSYGVRIIKDLLKIKAKVKFKNKVQLIGFSVKPKKDQSKDFFMKDLYTVTCETISYNKLGMQAYISSPWGSGEINLGLMGVHNLSNLLASIVISTTYLPFAELLKKTAVLKPVTGRLEKVKDVNKEIIIDYAHTPDGLEQALLAITRHYPDKKICCIFGCGGNRDAAKRPKMLEVADQYCNSIIVTQDNPRFEDSNKIIDDILSYHVKHVAKDTNLIIEKDRNKAINLAVQKYSYDHVILIAGKGHEKQQTIGDKEDPFCDYTVAREACISNNFLVNLV